MNINTYRRQQERTQNLLPGLRGQKQRRMLVNLFVIIALITTGCAFLIPAYKTMLLAIVAGLLLLAVIWTIIRIAIDSEDQAPPEALDEFQFERLERYRAFAFRLYGFFCTVIAFALIFAGNLWKDLAFGADTASRAVLGTGYVLLLITLTVSGYPALALAWNKPDDDA
ncbi:hypothetical protein [Corynebacterium epidermidicanis]|uniref:Uncharacterized protein n=1 Tax=Corynebacterium epidermidicanis TaxID=1050174 RepID=A0A0G3GUX0_9CORY|nr:hypothetical protein [Corynebacterium epidermidicanis]AKK02617.1 hypothetical protein CEPID_03715 [Corynebacterium epidermidicanis]